MTAAHVVTFHKCGSNWFRRIFREAADFNDANIRVLKPSDSPISVPVERGNEKSIFLHNNGSSAEVLPHVSAGDTIILCVRDPKDVLVSQYWSWKQTHTNNSPAMLQMREALNKLPQKAGLRKLVKQRKIAFCNSVESWLPELDRENIVLLKYEDLLSDFESAFGSALAHAHLSLSPDELRTIRDKYSFKSLTRREAGSENRMSHYRKGVAGDWKNYFDGRLTELFNPAYGAVCDALGYARPTETGTSKHSNSG